MENITIIPAIRITRLVAGKAPILIKIIIGRRVAKTMNTGIKVAPENWDQLSRSILKGEPNAANAGDIDHSRPVYNDQCMPVQNDHLKPE